MMPSRIVPLRITANIREAERRLTFPNGVNDKSLTSASSFNKRAPCSSAPRHRGGRLAEGFDGNFHPCSINHVICEGWGSADPIRRPPAGHGSSPIQQLIGNVHDDLRGGLRRVGLAQLLA